MSQSYANIIAQQALEKIRMFKDSFHIDSWREGRASACALMFPSIETLSAKNESSFLVRYKERHGAYK